MSKEGFVTHRVTWQKVKADYDVLFATDLDEQKQDLKLISFQKASSTFLLAMELISLMVSSYSYLASNE